MKMKLTFQWKGKNTKIQHKIIQSNKVDAWINKNKSKTRFINSKKYNQPSLRITDNISESMERLSRVQARLESRQDELRFAQETVEFTQPTNELEPHYVSVGSDVHEGNTSLTVEGLTPTRHELPSDWVVHIQEDG